MRLLLMVFLMSSVNCFSQTSGIFIADTMVFNLQSRQLTQFVNRFNNKDSQFKFDDKFENGVNLARKKNIIYLLNLEDTLLVKDSITNNFINIVASSNQTNQLSYFDTSWYAVAQFNIIYKGKKTDVALTLKPEGDNVDGYKWSIVGISPFLPIDTPSLSINNKLSPYDNEVNFVDLYHFFNKNENQLNFTRDDFQLDYLSILIYLINIGEIQFAGVNSIIYYFFQIENWYFTVENFIRPSSASSGWLISSINQIEESNKIHLIEKTLFVKN